MPEVDEIPLDGISSLRHHVGGIALTHGWLPIVLQLSVAAVVAGAVGWRNPRWRRVRLPVAVLAGVAFSVGAHWYIASLGVAGDPAPRPLWVWTTLTGLSAMAAVIGWQSARWWRRGLSLIGLPLCLLCCALVVNQWVGYFPTVHAAWNEVTAGPLPDQTDRITVTAMQMAGAHPDRGVVVPVTISSAVSRFAHRQELVYLPPAWFGSNPPPRLPVVMMIGAELNTPADWLRAGNAAVTADEFASRNGGAAPVLVFVDPTGAFRNDTECVNGKRGNAALHLTRDVVPFMISNFGVSADRSNWGIVGWSMGGTCAVDLTVRHPEMFSAFVDIAGDSGPNSGTKAQTIDQLFGGDRAAWADFDPATVILGHGTYTDVSGWFAIAGSRQSDGASTVDREGNPERQDLAAQSLCAVASTHGIDCAVVPRPGKHDWMFAATTFADTLPWLSGRLGVAGATRIPLPTNSSPPRSDQVLAGSLPTADRTPRPTPPR